MNYYSILSKKNIVGFLAILGLIVFGLIRAESDKRKLKTYGKYTIGKVTRIFGMRGGQACDYVFNVGGLVYKASNYTAPYNPSYNKYLIIFNEKNPEINRIILGAKIPDSIEKAPFNGWSKPPYKIENRLIETALPHYSWE